MLKAGQTVRTPRYSRSSGLPYQPAAGWHGCAGLQRSVLSGHPRGRLTAPGGVAVQVVKISGTVVGVDLPDNSLRVVNPSGGRVVTIDVTDPARIAMLPKLKVGDTISAVVSQVLAVTITPVP